MKAFSDKAKVILAQKGIPLTQLTGAGVSMPDVVNKDGEIVGLDTNKTANLAKRHDSEEPRDEVIIGKYDTEVIAREILQLYALRLSDIRVNEEGKLLQFKTGAALPWSGYAPPTTPEGYFKRLQNAVAELNKQGKAPYLTDKFENQKNLADFKSYDELEKYLKNNFVVKSVDGLRAPRKIQQSSSSDM